MRTSTVLSLLMVVCLAAVAMGQDTANLIRNGDFAKVANGRLEAWATSGDAATVTQDLAALQEPGVGAFARLACTRCQTRTPASHAMLTQSPVLLKKGRTYEFSAKVRARGIGAGAVGVAIRNTADWTDCGLMAEMPVSETWTTWRRVFEATQETGEQSRLQIWYTEAGTLDLADVRVSEHVAQKARFTDVVPTGTSRNLIRNGSFESAGAYWSSLGTGVGWGNLASLHGRVEQGGAAEGQLFLRIPLGEGRTPELFFDYYEPTARRELAPLAASLGWIPVETGKPYTLSCRMRASEAGVPAVVGVVEQTPGGSSRQKRTSVVLTEEWAPYTFTFRPQASYLFATIGPSLKEERTVHVDLDAVQLEQGEAATVYVSHDARELALVVARPVFYADEPVELKLWTSGGEATEVQVQARDYFGQTVTLPAVKVDGAGAWPVQFPSDLRGYYEVTATAGGASSRVRIAIVPRREARETVCGINHAFAPTELIRLCDMAGVSWYRDWSLKWQHIEPKLGEWRWEVGDRQIGRVLKEKMQVLPLLPPFPSADWNSEAPESLPKTGELGSRLRQAWAPKDSQMLADFIVAGVQRYKDRVHVWEFLNEPLYTDYALPADTANKYGAKKYGPSDYVSLLATAAKAMKAADPNCRVIGGLGGGPLQQYTHELLDAGLLKHIDILNLHMYPGLRAPEGFAAIMDTQLALMASKGGRKPIWITEFSYYGTDQLPREPFMPISWNWAENRLLADEKQCADYTIRYFLIMLSHGVERIFIHSGASGSANQPNLECSLLDYGGTPRRLFPAMAVLTSLLGDAPKSAGSRRIGEEGWCAGFETGKQSVVAFWTTSEMPATLPGGGEWMDIVGRRLDGPPATLGASPVYRIGKPGEAEGVLAAIGR